MSDPKRPPGRPPVTDDPNPKHVNLIVDSRDLQRAKALASREAITVPEVLRRGLKRLLAAEPPPDE